MSGASSTAGGPPTRRVTLTVGSQVFTDFSKVSIERDLQSLSGRFSLQCLDTARADAALVGPSLPTPLLTGAPATLAIDGEKVLIGYIGRVALSIDGERLSCEVGGLDKTGDLVRGAAFPSGPTEFRGIGLLALAQKVCAPFGITASADVDLGAPFPRLALHPEDTGRDVLDMAARQRGVLVTSDGLGGLVLTRGGVTRAPAPLWLGQNVVGASSEDDWSQRFSDYFVKGQTPAANGRRAGVAPALTHGVTPSGGPCSVAPGGATAIEAGGVLMTGHAIDPGVTRWLPTVRRARSQSGSSTVQEQAQWMLRTARGRSLSLHYRVLDWRDKPGGTLWRPNQVTPVSDPYCGINEDMLIAGVAFAYGAAGMITTLRVVRRGTYDLLAVADPVGPRHRDRRRQAPPAATAPSVP